MAQLMTDVLMRFMLHVRCESCARGAALILDVPNYEGAPTTVDDLMRSGLIDRQDFVCEGCDSQICQLVGVTPHKHLEAAKMEKRPMAAAGRVTLFVVMGCLRDKAGRLYEEQPLQVTTEDAARRKAQRYADAGGGAIATKQEGDPVLGDWDEPVVIARAGTVSRRLMNALDEVA